MALKTLAASVAAALLFACDPAGNGGTNPNTDPNDPIDTVFDFKPAYTAPKGTVYNGDFFPLKPNMQVAITVTYSDSTNYSSYGMYGGMPVDDAGTSAHTTFYTGFVKTLSARQVTLPSGTFTVIPEATGLAESGTPTSYDTAFYEKTAQEVIERASASDGSPRDADELHFLKLPLTVGETWAYGKTDSGITSKGRFYVTGLETITAGGKSYQALRIDQEGKAGGTYDDKGASVTYESHIHQVAWLVEGIGQVKQTWSSLTNSTTVQDNINGHLTLGQIVNRTMTMEAAGAPVPLAKIAAPAGPSLRTPALRLIRPSR